MTRTRFLGPKSGPKGRIWDLVKLLQGNPKFFQKSKKWTFFDPIGLKIGQNVVRGQLFWLRCSNCQIFGIFEDFWSFLSFLTLFGNGQIYLTYLLKNPNFLAQAYSRHMKLCLGANISIANAWFFCARSISVFGFFSDFFFLIFFEFLYLKSAKMDCLCLLKVYQGTLDIHQPCY